MIWGLKHLSNEVRLRELGMSSLDKGRLRADLVNTYKHLKSGYQEGGVKLLSVVPSDRTGSYNGHKLKRKKSHPNLRKNCLMLRVAEHWNKAIRESYVFLETFQAHLNTFLCNLLYLTLPRQGGWAG